MTVGSFAADYSFTTSVSVYMICVSWRNHTPRHIRRKNPSTIIVLSRLPG